MDAQKPSDQELVKTAFEAIEKLKKVEADPKWQKFADSPCVMYKIQVGERIMSKGEHKVNIPLEVLYEKLATQESLKTINPQLKQIQVLHVANADGKEARVNYMRYHGIWPVEDRDLVNVAAKEQGDGQCWIATQFCTFPFEKVNKVTRAHCHIGGWVLKKIDDKNTLVIYISDVDLAGSIPQMIKNQLAQKQASLPAFVEKHLK